MGAEPAEFLLLKGACTDLAELAVFSLRSSNAEAQTLIAPQHRVSDTPRLPLAFTGFAPGANHNGAPFGRLRLSIKENKLTLLEMKPSYQRFNAYQIMWLVVFFDLPVFTKTQRKTYADFRKALISDGFTMFQYSIYVRHCPSRENMDVHINRVSTIIPDEGKVCIISLTDKQFSAIKIFEGRKKATPCSEAIQLEIW